MKKRSLSILLTSCMLLCIVPVSALADDTALRSVAVQSIGPNEAEVELDLYEKMSAQVSVIKLISDIELSGSLRVDYAVTIDLNGHVLKMGDIGDGSVIKVNDGGHLTIIDSNPTATTYKFKDNGSGLWVFDSDGDKIVHGGVIYGGTGLTDRNNNGYGGGVYVEGGGKFTMTGGNIVGCKAEGYIAFGGGVFVAKSGTFEMTVGSIAGCTAVAQGYGMAVGGGIRNDGDSNNSNVGRTTLSGTAEIRDCHAKGVTGANQLYGGGISDAGTLTISGDVKIIGCTAGGMGSDAMYVNANNDSSVTGGTFYGSIEDPGNRISGLTVTYCLNNDENYATQVLQSGDQITLPDPAKLGYAFDGWYKDGTKWDKTTPVNENLTLTGWLYAPASSDADLIAALADDTADVIRLMRNIDINTDMLVERTVVLDLNGYVLRQTADRCVSFKVEEMGDLTIIDSNPTAPHKFTPNSDGLWVWDETGGTKTVNGGVITGNTAGNSGTIQIGGTVTMSAGNLVGCSVYNTRSGVAPSCGAVYVSANSKFVMNGGAIRGSFARIGDGGGVYVNGGQFTMNGGSITDCTVEYLGGGVYVNFGTFKLVDGYIRNCKADFGGGVCVRANMVSGKDGIFEMSGGVISDCTAKTKGSALIIDGNQLDYTGYAIGGTMYAGGGTVDGTAYIIKYGKITAKGGMTGVTSFKKEILTKAGSKIEYGLFYGDITGEGTVSDLTVTYLIGGVEYAKQVLPSGALATRPDDPTIPGYIFGGGWNKADGTAWDYATDTVTESITLYADLTVKTYTVTFDTAGGSEATPKTMDVTYGEQLGDMPVPKREGYVFLGWYDALAGGKCYGGSDGKSASSYDKDASITLYAQWADAPSRDVRFNTCGGTMTDPLEVRHKTNTPIARPGAPNKPGYTFTGWYTDITCTQAWNFDDWVTETMTLYAGWTVNRYTITFDTAGGSEIAPITQNYGTAITKPADPTREGYTFAGWDKEIPATMPAENITVKALWRINRYTITFDTDGGSEIAPITQNYGTAITKPGDPTREGYTFAGWDKTIPTTMPAENVTVKAKWQDTEKPTGEISVGTSKWKTFLNNITFGLFFKDTQTVTVTAADNSGEAVKIEYLLSAKKLTVTELAGSAFTVYTSPFGINPDNKYIIYVKLTDKAGNTDYICSDGIVLDSTNPVIGGIENGKTYCAAQTVTITEKYVKSITVNGVTVTPIENNTFTLTAADVEQKIVVIDEAGNTAEMTATVNNGHTPNADDGDCTTPVYCKFCNAEVIAAESHDFIGDWHSNETEHWHICQNENCTVTDTKTAHSGDDDGDCTTAVLCGCGHVITAAKPAHTFGEWVSGGDGTHTRKCTENGCNGSETENCSGGKATCTDKAICEVCGKPYGEPSSANHADLKHVEAKEATEKAEGNTEYWHCDGCDKYYSDAAAAKEITKADTVTEKLPDSGSKPQTGDGRNPAKWIALLFISGGVLAGAAVFIKKKKRSEK